MKTKAIAAAAATVLALSAGSAFAWDLHDTLAPASNPTPTVSQTSGADLQIPGAGTVTSGGAAYDFQCADAKAKYPIGSFQIATYCAPGDR